MKFTPGQWRISSVNANGDYQITSTADVRGQESPPVAICPNRGCLASGEAKDNAELVTMAPEMYRKLVQCYHIVNDDSRSDSLRLDSLRILTMEIEYEFGILGNDVENPPTMWGNQLDKF